MYRADQLSSAISFLRELKAFSAIVSIAMEIVTGNLSASVVFVRSLSSGNVSIAGCHFHKTETKIKFFDQRSTPRNGLPTNSSITRGISHECTYVVRQADRGAPSKVGWLRSLLPSKF